MMAKQTIFILALVAPFVFGGCSLVPDYLRPEMPVAAQWPAPAKQTTDPATLQPAADLGWQDFFTDPQLRAVISKALINNRDLRESALNVQSYQAQYRIQRSALMPAVTGSGEYAKQRTMSGDHYATGEAYSAAVGITSYELDFFGRVRNLNDQALEQYLAMEQTQKSSHISLVAEVARAYLTLLADRELLRLTEETLASEQASYDLIEQRYREGIATQIDLAQAQTSLQSAKANQAQYRRQAEQDGNQLTLLAGSPIEDLLPREVALTGQLRLCPLPTGLSSQVLLQRPDIMAAEHDMKAANANIGAARAAFFPTIGLTAQAGVLSSDLDKLFNGSSGTWLFAPAITVPIFTGGKLQAQLDVAEIRKEISVARYEKAIQAAFRETADSLAGLATYEDQVQARTRGLQANQQYYDLARSRYEQGVDSYLVLLDAQRSLYNARQAAVSVRLAQLVNQVNLYKALGGGWKAQS